MKIIIQNYEKGEELIKIHNFRRKPMPNFT